MIGRTLSHYQIVEKLGEGGMGVVYRAVDRRLARPVAIKVLPHDAASDAARLRFAREAKAASSLNHPNIVTVHDVDVSDGVHFIAMEYVTGRTLDRLIDGKGLFVKDALKIAVQIADAVATAHAVGIVHRDLKPANVMVTDKGLVKVLDFGLAKLIEHSDPEMTAAPTITDANPRTEEGTILGTTAYMSPEQAEGKTIDARSDIFSFGSLLYEMLTGRRAFRGETKMSTLSAILHVEPPPASEIASNVRPELDHIISHCLRKDPDRRFQHLDDVRTLLEGIRDDAAAAAHGVESRARVPSAFRGRIGLGIAMAAIVVTAGISWLALHRFGPAGGSPSEPVNAGSPSPPARPRLSNGGPASTNAEANRYFETALQVLNVSSFDTTRGQALLTQALALDPNFAEARALFGFTHWLLIDFGDFNDPTLLYKAEQELRRALQDDATLARAHASFAAIYMMQGRKELVPAEVALAVKANPGDADATTALMWYHQYTGDFDTARRVGQGVLDRHPLFFPSRMCIGEVARQQGDLAGAIREQLRILDQDPQNLYALTYLARTHMDGGDLAGARAALQRLRPENRRNLRARRTWALLLALEGKRAEAVKEMDADVLKWSALVAYETSELADFFAILGDATKALEWLDAAIRNGDERAEWFRRDPLLANVRNHPGFQEILASISNRRQQRKTGQ